MSEITDLFIKTVGLLARNEYLSRPQWILPSVCIAQAAIESGWNLKAKSVFGIKGNGFISTTSEFYDGNYVEIQASFKDYKNLASSVVGYYDFLRDTPRYSRALNQPSYLDTVVFLINTIDGAPYATDSDYIAKVISIIEDYNLTEYDTRDEVQAPAPEPEPTPSQENTYTVQSGDCLSVIAQNLDVDLQALADLNGIVDINKIQEGQILNIPMADQFTPAPEPAPLREPYTVQSGDCLSIIAQNLGVDIQAIADLNGIVDINKIQAGQVLNIPQ